MLLQLIFKDMESRFIKTKGSLMLLALYAVVATSCSDIKKEVKTFATEFAQNVNSKKMDAVQEIYPDAAKIDSFALDFNPDSIVVTETETPNVFRVSFSSNKNMLVQRADDGKLTVKESHGLYAISPKEMDFALKTGWVKQDMPDVQLATQMADTAFVSYISSDFIKSFKKKFHISKFSDSRHDYASDLTGGGEWTITVKNDCDIDIAGIDYNVELVSPISKKKNVIFEGKDIFSGVEAVFKSEFLDSDFYILYDSEGPLDWREPTAKINILLSDVELLSKYFHPDGNEYENYLKNKNQ